MNDEIILMSEQRLRELPFEIKDVFLLVNCYSIQKVEGGHDVGGSCILTVRGTPQMSAQQKLILLAEMIRRLELSQSDFIGCMSNLNRQGWTR